MATKQKHKISRLQKHVSRHGITSVAKEISSSSLNGVTIHIFRVRDGYHQSWYRLERFGSKLLASRLEAYLAKRPHLDFDHPRNRASKLLYTLPSFAEWATLMPGAQALEPIHHPEQKRLTTGKRIDPITRRLFRHGLDPVAIRTRTLMGGWLAHHYLKNKQNQDISWLSLAGGTAVPSMLMVNASGVDKRYLYYSNIDMDSRSIEIAGEITAFEGLDPHKTRLLSGDIFDKDLIARATSSENVDIIDMMGIFEYMDTGESIRLLKMAYALLKDEGIIITCNMRPEHRQLNLNKRGVGWPDVRPRTAEELIDLCQTAGISSVSIDIYRPVDGVYNILRIKKT